MWSQGHNCLYLQASSSPFRRRPKLHPRGRDSSGTMLKGSFSVWRRTVKIDFIPITCSVNCLWRSSTLEIGWPLNSTTMTHYSTTADDVGQSGPCYDHNH